MDKKELLARLEQFRIGPEDASLSFSRRLARENGWREEYAERVVAEYKRFLYLAATSAQQLTPSDQVDQAWHLHLTYTESYWQELCGKLLGFSLHHCPTRGGEREQGRFRDQYGRTLELYEQCFGAKPPRDIWPTVTKRFANAEDFVRVNKRDTWLFKKPASEPVRSIGLVLTLGLLVSCADSVANGELEFWVKTFVGAVAVVYLLKKLNDWLGGSRKSGGGNGSGGAGCGGCSGCGGCGS